MKPLFVLLLFGFTSIIDAHLSCWDGDEVYSKSVITEDPMKKHATRCMASFDNYDNGRCSVKYYHKLLYIGRRKTPEDRCFVSSTNSICECFAESDCNNNLEKLYEIARLSSNNQEDLMMLRVCVEYLQNGFPSSASTETTQTTETDLTPSGIVSTEPATKTATEYENQVTGSAASSGTNSTVLTEVEEPTDGEGTSKSTRAAEATKTTEIKTTELATKSTTTDISTDAVTTVNLPPSKSNATAWHIGAGVSFAVLMAAILALIVTVIVLLKKKGGAGKKANINEAQKTPLTLTAIAIKNPTVVNKDTSAMRPASNNTVSNTPVAQPEAEQTEQTAVSGQDCDDAIIDSTTSGCSGSDSTGTDETAQVRVTVSGFKKQ